MYRVSVAFAALSFVLLVSFMAPPAHAQESGRQEKAGIRGRVVVEPELLAATERPIDVIRAEALETSAHVRRPRGRRLLPMMAAMPDLAVVIQGEDVRVDSPSPKTLVIEGMRFVPGQVLLTKPGSIAVENRQDQALTVMGKSGALATIAAGETKQVALSSDKGDQVLFLKEMPFARAVAKVLDRGLAIPFDANGDMPFTSLVEGEYNISFWMGSDLLYGPTSFQVKRNRTSFIDATISAHGVVTVAVKDASMFVAVPVVQPELPPDSEQ